MKGPLIGLCGLITFGLTAGSPATAAEDYPERAIQVIVPWSAGGGTDVTIRGFLDVASRMMDANFNVSNVTGGGGAVGWGEAAGQPADGYHLVGLTYDLLMITAKDGPVDYRDFIPLVTIAQYPQVFAVDAESDHQTFEDFVEYASSASTPLAVAMGGFGGIHHLAAIAMQQAEDFEMRMVPFEGGAASIAALLGGNVQATFTDVPESAGRPDLRVLVVFGDERHPDMPDVPTARELGMDVVLASFRSLGTPQGTPEEIVDYLRQAFDEVWHSEEFQNWAETANVSPGFLSGADTEAMYEAMMPLLFESAPLLEQ